MKYVLALFLVGCSVDNVTNIKYGSQVKVVSGFFEGCEGIANHFNPAEKTIQVINFSCPKKSTSWYSLEFKTNELGLK